MDRRDVLVTGAGLGMLAISGRATAEKTSDAPAKSAAASARDAVVVSTADCAQKGAVCSAHCAQELGKGNTAMAHCAMAVEEMLAFVRTMLTLAARGFGMAKKLAPLCAEACRACADACLEHKEHWAHGMHLPCKACLESCLTCEKACTALAAS